MKRILLALLLLVPLFASCDIETSDNGDLDGYWQLARVDTIDGGSCDMVAARIFWAIQVNLLQVSDRNYLLDSYLLRFDQNDKQLRVYDPYLSDRDNGDQPVTNPEVLRPFGIQSLDEEFRIDLMDGDRLVLSSSLLRLRFNRY